MLEHREDSTVVFNMKVLLPLLVILGVSSVLCEVGLELCQRCGSKKQGLHIARVKKNQPNCGLCVLFIPVWQNNSRK